ncbi:MAG: diguanylate cyclase, partial [Clostridia bacterium]|nr:diguanylate cyclase [Clostridia bacterium]
LIPGPAYAALHMQDPVSISVGVTFASSVNTSYEALLDKADQALYLAKKKKNSELVHWEFSRVNA